MLHKSMTREELAAWLARLRDPSSNKGSGVYYSRWTRCYCAVGLIGPAIGDPTCGGYRFHELTQWLCEATVGDLDLCAHRVITSMSDGGVSFLGIADYVERNLAPLVED